jgi:hypothetical protein
MKRLLPAFIALLITFGFGVSLTMYLRQRHRQTNKPWAANPCRDGLAAVDNTAAPTLKITLLETSCETQTAAVHLNVTNVGTTQIKYFTVRAIYTYDNYVDDGAEVGTGPLAPGQSKESFIGMGPPGLAHDKPVGQLRGITLIPSLLEFEDGRKWRQPFIHEPKPKCRTLPNTSLDRSGGSVLLKLPGPSMVFVIAPPGQRDRYAASLAPIGSVNTWSKFQKWH